MLLLLPDGTKFGSNTLVSDFMKGAYRLNPPKPRYCRFWDPTLVLNFLKKWSPARKIDLKQLSMKTLMLILLTTACRIDTVSKLSLDRLEITSTRYTFELAGEFKQSRPGYKDPLIVLRSYPADRRLCIFTYMTEYLKRTTPSRGDVRTVFLTYQKPVHAPSKDTLSRWAKTVLQDAGVDTKRFTSHSTRGASASAAERGGATLDEVLMTAGWSKDSTFAKYYRKPFLKEATFDKAVLRATKE